MKIEPSLRNKLPVASRLLPAFVFLLLSMLCVRTVESSEIPANLPLLSAPDTKTALSPTSAASIRLDIHRKYQTIDGFGGSFAMWGFHPDPAIVRYIVEDLGLSMVRLHADGAWRDGEGVLHHGYEPGTGWSQSKEWNQSVSAAIEAVKAGADKILLSFWYPPTSYLNDISSATPFRWDASPAERNDWAQAIVDRAKQLAFVGDGARGLWEVNPKATILISPQNEPNLLEGGTKASWAYFSPPQLLELMQAIHTKITDSVSGFGTKADQVLLVGPELTSAEPYPNPPWTYDAVGAFSGNVYAVSHHLYDSYPDDGSGIGGTDPGYANLKARLNRLRTAVGTARLWMTETTGTQWNGREWHTLGWRNTLNPGMDKALGAAHYIHYSLTESNAGAFLWWGLTYADPNSISETDPLKAQKMRDEGLILVNHREDPMTYSDTTLKYYAFKQFSAFIRPGYQRIDTSSDSSILASAYESGNADTVVMVLIHAGDAGTTIAVQGLPPSLGNLRVVMTTEERHAEEGWLAGSPWYLPAKSIATLIFSKTD